MPKDNFDLDRGEISCDSVHLMLIELPEPPAIPTIPPMESWLTVTEAAELLGLTRSRIYNLIREGRLRSEKSGNLHKVSAADVEEYAASERKGGWPKGTPRKPETDRRSD